MKKITTFVLIALIAGFMIIQLVPYGRSHQNPPVVQAAAWNSPAAQQIAERACYDCHSNQTTWPWYSNVAPMSWVVQRDVEEGRHELNFSNWGQGEAEAEELREVVLEGEMPPAKYTVIHPEARLNEAERQTLLDGFPALPSGEGEEAEDDD